jgi:hypothetical protein
MNSKYREALPFLHDKLKFDLEEISATDLFYNDGDSRVLQSFFKLVLTRSNHSVAVVYIQEGTFWVSFGSLTDAEKTALQEWIHSLTI